jgi:septum formation protein
MPELILASTSKYRRELLERLCVPFRCVAPRIDEEAEQNNTLRERPRDVAMHLAQLKAGSIVELEPQAIVIGSDQVCTFEGQVLHKPGTAERAREQLSMLAGRTHELVTAVCVQHGEVQRKAVVTTQLRMRSLTGEEIARYVAADNPVDCAGSYKIESLGISLFEAIETPDYTAIVGLPLMAVATALREFGIPVP